MSPSPDLSSQSPTPPLPEQTSVTNQAHTSTDESLDESLTAPASGGAVPEESTAEDAATPTLRRPPMRPTRPLTPVAPAPPAKPVATTAPSPKPLGGPRSETVPASTADPTPTLDASAQGILRQQPIPPPSEPKQYRAIGLVRGRYQSSEEEFTSGTLTTTDGVEMKAVLLGRVMSLVRNHLDLEQEHLWVVYPRTRESTNELNMQIMGVWEPETLKRPASDEDDSTVEETATSAWDTPEDGYFSVRGEVVFYSPEESLVVIKIQQTPKKNSQKAKAFKLSLQGILDSQKTLGYFWDFHVKRQAAALVIAEATCIGMTPPKKRSKEDGPASRGGRPGGFRKPFARVSGGGRPSGKPAPGGAPSGAPSGAPVRREPLSKPVKRSVDSTTPPSES